MSSTSDKVDGPAERDDKEGDAERENEQQQEISATSTAPQPQPQPPAEAAGTESNEEKSDDVDPLEKDIEKVRIFTRYVWYLASYLFFYVGIYRNLNFPALSRVVKGATSLSVSF
jgi:hypothetical protein